MSGGKIILLVDDDTDLVESNKILLEGEGYTVYTASDGKSGVEEAKKVKPDLMILDVMMAHDTEGFDISRSVAKVPELEGLQVIMLTGIREKKNLPFGFEPDEMWLPCKAVLEKPIAPDKLLAEVRKVLGGE